MKKKVLVITGTRAEYGLLYSTIKELQTNRKVEMRLLVTGMHTLPTYGNTIEDIRRDNIRIDCIVPVQESDSMSEALAAEIRGIEKYCLEEKPDLLLVLGDRGEPFAGAIVAGHLHIPVAHIHGGDTSGSATVDELVRHSITKLAHLHFPTALSSAKRLRALGEEAWRITVAGAPGLDAIVNHTFPSRDVVAKEHTLDISKKWLLIVHHPTPFDTTPFESQIRPLLNVVVADFPDAEKILIYPNTDTGSAIFIQEIERLRSKKHVHIYPNLERAHYLALFKHAACIIGNSSSGIIESTTLKVPSISIGSRQEGRDRGANIITSKYDTESIQKALIKALSKAFSHTAARAKSPYGKGTAGSTIARMIEKQIVNPKLMIKKALP